MNITTLRTWLLTALLAAPPALAQAPAESASIEERMRAGGVVILMRHARTDPGIGDPPGFTLADCASQRNLSAAGRDEARRFGQRLRELQIPVTQVRTSQWCRCVDTAELAFGEQLGVEHWQPLDSFFAGQGSSEQQTRDALAALQHVPAEQTWLWVTHQVNITALTGEVPPMGEAVVVRAREDGLEIIGRWRP